MALTLRALTGGTVALSVWELPDESIEAARAKLDKAQEAHTEACKAAGVAEGGAVAKATEAWDKKVADAQRELDVQASGSQAEAHTADQKVAGVRAAIDKHCERIKEQLGVDLQGIVDFSG